MSAWQIDTRGLLAEARYVASPNQDERPPDTQITMVVIHNISLPPDEYGSGDVERLFTNQLDPDTHPYFAAIWQNRVSAHFFIRRDGELIQFVPCLQRAWHAGISSWQGRERCNDFSVGVELEGCDTEAFEEVQYTVLNHVLDALRQTYPITDIVGHSDIAPGRKTDPGPCFDWKKIKKD
ncbi:MAG TPA: 1,6-anhydro-N-acetylmuramyl-L-alanine amidase AmpD [Methylophilaceae bacterium]|nr:1,6-anhydro-N-acetylmuramyl-L-alanine amidase AmpD [Methylophilaceae bacterium]